jgi:cytoskeletal protein CcmA (bactofilin family)
MGRNPKEDLKNADTTADHTPQPLAPTYGTTATGTTGSSANGNNGSGASSDNHQTSAHVSNSARAVTESESLARDIKEGTLSGFVGNGTMLTGEASFKGMLRVDGHLSGRINSQDGTLIVSTNGQVDANVEVSVAQILGTVNGDIVASKRIELGRVARVTGNIQTPALVIENGAMFEGTCHMVKLKDAHEKHQSKSGSAATTTTSPSAATASTPSPSAPGLPSHKGQVSAGSMTTGTNGDASKTSSASDAIS